MTMFVLVYMIYIMHHPVYIYIQFIVYKCLSKKNFPKKSYSNQIKSTGQLELLAARGSLQPRGTRGSWSSLGWLARLRGSGNRVQNNNIWLGGGARGGPKAVNWLVKPRGGVVTR